MNHTLNTCPRTPALRHAFTLVELLIVIAIISILAALIFPITHAVQRQKILNKARTELNQVDMAIKNYHEKLGHYPPDNPGMPSTNQLYFELLGTTNAINRYTTLDGSASVSAADMLNVFGPNVTGFVNCSQTGGGDESRLASPFLRGLNPGQYARMSQTNAAGTVYALVTTAWASDPFLPTGTPLNPFRYVSTNPKNNPRSFDLWVDVMIGAKTNRISNWSSEPLVVGTPY